MTEAARDMLLEGEFEPASRQQWLALVEKAIKGADFEKKLVSRTADGIRIEPLYTRDDALHGKASEQPGQPPFTRGTHARDSELGWEICQYHCESDAALANAAILEDLTGGANAIALGFESMGTGLPVAASAVSRALEGVLLDVCPILLVAGEKAPEAAGHLTALWDSKGIRSADRRGAYNFDPLGLLAVRGGLMRGLDASLAEAARLVSAAQAGHSLTALTADGTPYHAAGASEAQELAAVLATMVKYLRSCEAAGIATADALPRIAVNLAVDADQFLGIAKLRAARQLVWRIADACGSGPAAAKVQYSAITAWRMMAKRDPWTNMLRTTIACAAAGLGGADRITVLPFTFALGKPDRFARRIARNTQIVLQEESSLGKVVDPAGGSWYVERLTDELARKAWALFQQIEAAGGMAAALDSGLVQGWIGATADARLKSIATGRAELTGISAFPLLGDDGVTVDPWPRSTCPANAPSQTVKPLKMARLAEPFEAMRDAADAFRAATGAYPKVFLASIGPIIAHTGRSTWVRNYLASAGIEAITSDGYPDADAAAAAFKASGAKAACIASSDALYEEHAEKSARALKAAGAALVLMAGRPGEREPALKAAGADRFLYAGADAIATLGALHAALGVTR